MLRSKETSLRALYTLYGVQSIDEIARDDLFETAHPSREQLALVIHQCNAKKRGKAISEGPRKFHFAYKTHLLEATNSSRSRLDYSSKLRTQT